MSKTTRRRHFVALRLHQVPQGQKVEKQIAAARAYAGSRPVWAGIGAYQLSPAQTLAHIAAANKLGVAGVILFSYDSITAPPNGAGSVSELGRAAFGTAPE